MRVRPPVGARAVAIPPLLADCPDIRHNYRQHRDNPPQFYGMLSHEVFAPQRRLHALHGVNTPLTPAGILLGGGSPGVNEDMGSDTGSCYSGHDKWRAGRQG